MRKPSAETELRTTRRLLNNLRAEIGPLNADRNRWRDLYTQASRDEAEWKRRFDALLKIVPTLPVS